MSERLHSRFRLLITIGLAAFVAFATITADPPSEDRAREIGAQVRCPVCEGEAIANSPSPLAEDMMSLVRTRIDEGLSNDQIIDELIAAYSGSQLLDPPFSWETAALWLIPAIVLGVGVTASIGRTRTPAPRAVNAED